MSDEKFERFGKYLILDHLVDGGMAKICRARFLGEQANKLVAIKMVQAQFSKDPSFVKMFEDELKVTFGLLHPNIVQVTDYGMVNNQLYSAMEYVDGANLKQFLDRLKQKNFVFPVEISTYIISQVCQGLHYAHTFTDKLTGKPTNIIHRDISPHNIMLTYDGAVKVIDFGIAKADSNSEATQAGTIKGKLSYLAPEYLDGLELDARYDLFAVGITLWEMLCSRKLFSAANDLAVLKHIQACKVPRPSSINPNVPKELDEIVLKALSKDRNQRYENMDQFNRALVRFLYSHYPDFNATDLSYFAKQLFKEEIESDRKKFVDFGKIDITSYLNDLKNDSNQSQNSAVKGKVELDFNFEDSTKIDLKLDSAGISSETVKKKNPSRSEPQKSSRVQNTQITPDSSSQTRTRRVKTQKLVVESSSPKWFKVAMVLLIFCGLSYYKADSIKKITGVDIKSLFTGQDEQFKERSVAASVGDVKFGKITLVNYDSSMKVNLNGKEIKTNGIDIKVPIGKPLKVTISKMGYETFKSSSLMLSSDTPFGRVMIPQLNKASVGVLSSSLNFTSGSKLILDINGERVEKTLPFENFNLPAAEYNAVIVNPLLGTQRKVKFKITENRKSLLE